MHAKYCKHLDRYVLGKDHMSIGPNVTNLSNRLLNLNNISPEALSMIAFEVVQGKVNFGTMTQEDFDFWCVWTVVEMK